VTCLPAATGIVSMATVLAKQAKAAGVTIKLSNVPFSMFFGKDYLSWAFSQDFYNFAPYLAQVAQSMLPTPPYNETHTDNPTLNSLYKQANATLNEQACKQIEYEMQQFDFNQGATLSRRSSTRSTPTAPRSPATRRPPWVSRCRHSTSRTGHSPDSRENSHAT
jgi:hypothetical protein